MAGFIGIRKRDYLAALAPLVDEGRVDDTVPLVSAAGSWTEGPIFVGEDQGAPSVDDVSASVRPNRSPSSRRVVDMSALVPRSDSLFVRVSARERPR